MFDHLTEPPGLYVAAALYVAVLAVWAYVFVQLVTGVVA
jgi:hypothetical protein